MRLLIFFSIPLFSFAQKIKQVRIGDTIPSIQLNHIFNNPGNSVLLNDYNGKLIIIDFWNRWCKTCIEDFPKMESLQEEFGDKIKILLVTTDNDSQIRKLFEKVRKPALPIISQDTVFNSMFPHVSVPHHVWIDKDGVVKFITDGYNATSKNISNALNGVNFTLNFKNDDVEIDEKGEIWKEGQGKLQKYITNYSLGTNKIDEYGKSSYSFQRDTISNTIGFKFINIPLLTIYKIAFGYSMLYQESAFSHNNRVIFDLPGAEKPFLYPLNTDSISDWEKRNLVCYESQWQMSNTNAAYQYLQNDINRFFPLEVKVEEREIECYLIKQYGYTALQRPSSKIKSFEFSDSVYRFTNLPISTLVNSLNSLEIFVRNPVIDDSGFPGPIDIKLNNACSSLNNLNRELIKNGLILEKKKKYIPMLVIRKKEMEAGVMTSASINN